MTQIFNYKTFYERNIAVHYASLHKYICFWGLSKDASEEIAQEAMSIAWEKIKQLKDPAKARPWLFAIARNLIKKHYRQSTQNEYYIVDNAGDLMDQVANPDMEVLNILEMAESRIIIEKVLNRMSDKYRRILILYYYYDHNLIDISKIMNMKYNTVKTNYYRALNKMRILYNEYESGRENGA